MGATAAQEFLDGSGFLYQKIQLQSMFRGEKVYLAEPSLPDFSREGFGSAEIWCGIYFLKAQLLTWKC